MYKSNLLRSDRHRARRAAFLDERSIAACFVDFCPYCKVGSTRLGEITISTHKCSFVFRSRIINSKNNIKKSQEEISYLTLPYLTLPYLVIRT